MSVVVNNTGVVTGAGRAITLTAAKEHLDVTHDDDDTRILALIDVATEYFAGLTQNPVIKTNFEMYLEDWHNLKCFELPRWPLHTLTEIGVKAPGSDTYTAVTVFEAITRDKVPSEIVLKPNESMPLLNTDKVLPIRVQWIAGYEPGSIPVTIQHAIKLLVRHLYDHPDAVADKTMRHVPMTLMALVNSHRPGHVPGMSPGVVI